MWRRDDGVASSTRSRIPPAYPSSLSSFTCGQNYSFSDPDATDSRDSRTCKHTHHLAARLQLAASTRAATATKHGRLSIPPPLLLSSWASLPQQKTRRRARSLLDSSRDLHASLSLSTLATPARQIRYRSLVLSIDRAKSVTIQRRRNRARYALIARVKVRRAQLTVARAISRRRLSPPPPSPPSHSPSPILPSPLIPAFLTTLSLSLSLCLSQSVRARRLQLT